MSLTGKEGSLLSAIELGPTLRFLEAQLQVPASHITSKGSSHGPSMPCWHYLLDGAKAETTANTCRCSSASNCTRVLICSSLLGMISRTWSLRNINHRHDLKCKAYSPFPVAFCSRQPPRGGDECNSS